MIKKRKPFSYLICMMSLVILSIFLFSFKKYTIYLLKAMTDEFLPALGEDSGFSLIYEFIPVCGVSRLDDKPGLILDVPGDNLSADSSNDAELSEDLHVGNPDDMDVQGVENSITGESSESDKRAEAVGEATDKNTDGKEAHEDTDNKGDGEITGEPDDKNSDGEKADKSNDKKDGEKKTDKNDISKDTVEKPHDKDNADDEAADEKSKDSVTVSAYPNGIVYDRKNLLNYDFLINNLYNVASSTSVYPEELDAEKLLDMDMTMDLSGDEYKILIYHTHGSEAFADSREGVLEDTVVGLGDELTRILEEDYGISVYHDRTIYDMMSGTLDRSGAYDYAAEGIDKILAEYPSIQIILDIHRDGVNEDVHLVKVIDGKPTAQIMLLNGMSRLNSTGDIDYLYNQYKEENLSFSLKLQLTGKELYGDLMRRIFISGYCYNLNRKPRAALIEVGAQTNTVEEAQNAMEPLAKTLYKVLSEE